MFSFIKVKKDNSLFNFYKLNFFNQLYFSELLAQILEQKQVIYNINQP